MAHTTWHLESSKQIRINAVCLDTDDRSASLAERSTGSLEQVPVAGLALPHLASILDAYHRRLARRQWSLKTMPFKPEAFLAVCNKRVSTRTASKSRLESVGAWMLLSTTVQSMRTSRAFSVFSAAVWPRSCRLICSQVSADRALMFLLRTDFLNPLSATR